MSSNKKHRIACSFETKCEFDSVQIDLAKSNGNSQKPDHDEVLQYLIGLHKQYVIK